MENIRIFCENDGKHYTFPMGTELKDMSPGPDALAALVDNQLKELSFKAMTTHNVRFIGYDHPDGRRTYIRSLCFVLQNVIREMYPDKVLAIDYSLPSGLYCEIREREHMYDGRPKVYFATDDEVEKIHQSMNALIAADLPFMKTKMTLDETVAAFDANGQKEKVSLVRSLGRLTYSVYTLDGHKDTFYGPLALSTGYLKTFDLIGFNNGFCLQYPMDGSYGKVLPLKR